MKITQTAGFARDLPYESQEYNEAPSSAISDAVETRAARVVVWLSAVREAHQRKFDCWSLLYVLILISVATSLKADTHVLTLPLFAHRVKAAYARVHSAVVFIQGFRESGGTLWRKTGVIVTTDGLVLCTPGPKVSSIEVTLPDGRQTKARVVGQSTAWDLALLRLNGQEAWPHIKLESVPDVSPGQSVITFGYREPHTAADRLPSIRIETVSREMSSAWFDTTGESAQEGWTGELVFNLDGKLIGVGDVAWYGTGHRFYTQESVVQRLWTAMAAGKDVDQDLLWPPKREKQSVEPFPLGSTFTDTVKKRAASATVRMHEADEPQRIHPFVMTEHNLRWSGVIVNAAGLIVTCAHHLKMPGTKLSIYLSDDRIVSGEVVAINPMSDIGLVKITSAGVWPFVEIGDSRRLTPGAPCLAIGYPDNMTQEFAHPPILGEGVAEDSTFIWHPGGAYLLRLKANRPYPAEMDGPSGFDTGGMSGGGVFDVAGRLVANMKGGNDKDGAYSVRIETVRADGEALLHGRYLPQTSPSNLAHAVSELCKEAEPVRRSVVTILNGDKATAYGTIVSATGRIVTRASGLPASPSCRLSDGRIVRARLLRVLAENDLALLEIAESNPPSIRVEPLSKDPSIGQMVAFPMPGGPITTGYVSCSAGSLASFPAYDNIHRTGFSRVFDVEATVDPKLPGGPILDASGRMIGMVITSPSSGWVTALPLSLIMKFIYD